MMLTASRSFTWLLPLPFFLALLWLCLPLSNWFRVSDQLLRAEKQQVTMLIWHWPFGESFDLNSCEAKFNIRGCRLTANRELFGIADAVLIHHREIEWDLSNLPRLQRPHFQKWLWMNFESPSNSKRIIGLNNQFNLTVSYRRDADMSFPYGSIIRRTREKTPDIPNKNKLVCWIVSNWSPEHKRIYYYKALRKFIHIHSYGRPFYSQVSESEYTEIVASCKFYLAFENSIHEDYITEKVYRPLGLGSVPVVLGPSRENYERFIPGEAFIHVDDFSSPQALAQRLLYLDQDTVGYQKYFAWKREHRVSLTLFPLQTVCHSCDYIRQHYGRKQTVNNLYEWYWGKESVQEWL